MDQQIALLKQEHEEALRQLKQQHSKELEAEVDRHREELETALTRAQLCLLSPSLPHNDAKELETIKAERDNLVKERDALTKERDTLQHKVRLVTRELEESAKSLTVYSDQLSERDEKIARLKDETKSLLISLNNVTSLNQTLKEKSKNLKRRMSTESSYAESGSGAAAQVTDDDDDDYYDDAEDSGGGTTTSTSSSSAREQRLLPRKPLFENPFVDKYWGLLYLTLFGLVLLLHSTIFSSNLPPN